MEWLCLCYQGCQYYMDFNWSVIALSPNRPVFRLGLTLSKRNRQESFTSRNLELCAWQESFSLGTSLNLDTLCSGYITCWHLCNEPDPKKVQFVRQITLGVNESWNRLSWDYSCISIIFQIDEQFFRKKIEISRLNISNTNCMENMACVIKDRV